MTMTMSVKETVRMTTEGVETKVFVLNLSSVQPKTSKQPFSSRQGIVSFWQKISKIKGLQEVKEKQKIKVKVNKERSKYL